ncbi:HDOD domain-containing protein [Aestuariibacter sp. AA17]|uniref:HDOD domain-containing protein n=1 Tax=Fluctibacter corallii TaxID=2984329 RepID=A0ABT3A452_9ALTE|nr:HDOD domain-containing protein [Aestuariibacter sp. AA17]MCV2883467.1 HDOD domain-containing protein [Aestuariibacter sp. AA17]
MQITDYTRYASQSFTLPEICVRIRKMLDDDSSNIDDIAALVGVDPSLTSKLLKLANSPLFRFRSQVDSISKAINVIGGEALYNLVMAETASSAFSQLASKDFDLVRFWNQSLYCALVAKDLAKLLRIRGSEKFFLLGLMHNLGELVVSAKTPNLAEECGEFSDDISPWQKQKNTLKFHFTDCSAAIMRDWLLPEQLCYMVEHIHDQPKALSNKEIAVLYSALRISASMVAEKEFPLTRALDNDVTKQLDLDDSAIQDAMRFARMEASKMLSIMKPKVAA